MFRQCSFRPFTHACSPAGSHRPAVALLGTGLLLLAACASTPATEAQEARVEAVGQRADQQQEAIDDRAEHRRDAIEDNADRQREYADRSQPDTEAELTKKEVNLSEKQATYLSDSRARLSKANVRVNEAKQKLELEQRYSVDVAPQFDAAHQQMNEISRRLSAMETTPARQWDDERKRLEERFDDLDTRVDRLADRADD